MLQFHHDEISELPTGATLLASSPMYANQAFRVGRHVYGLQFHIETTPEIVHEWAERDVVGVAASPHDRETICLLSDEAAPARRRRPGRRSPPVRRPGARPRARQAA